MRHKREATSLDFTQADVQVIRKLMTYYILTAGLVERRKNWEYPEDALYISEIMLADAIQLEPLSKRVLSKVDYRPGESKEL